MEKKTKSKPLSKAGLEERKIYKSLAKLRRYPDVQEIFKESAQLFRDKKIKNISQISKNKKIRDLVKKLSTSEKKMYKKHLRKLGFPSLEDFSIIARKAKLVVKKIGQKKDEISQAANKFSDQIQNVKERDNPILKT